MHSSSDSVRDEQSQVRNKLRRHALGDNDAVPRTIFPLFSSKGQFGTKQWHDIWNEIIITASQVIGDS